MFAIAGGIILALIILRIGVFVGHWIWLLLIAEGERHRKEEK